MVAYTTPAAIAAYLGVTFTPEQATAAEQVADAVTLYVDRYTGRSWQAVSPAVREPHAIVPPVPDAAYGPAWVFLDRAPAVAVSAVSIRSTLPHAYETPLDPNQYELVDPEHGTLALSTWYYGWYSEGVALVDYTYADAVPADIALASTMIGAAEMARQLAVQSAASFSAAHPETDGLKSVSIGQNAVAVTYADAASAATSGGAAAGAELAPPGSTARTILDGYKRVVLA